MRTTARRLALPVAAVAAALALTACQSGDSSSAAPKETASSPAAPKAPAGQASAPASDPADTSGNTSSGKSGGTSESAGSKSPKPATGKPGAPKPPADTSDAGPVRTVCTAAGTRIVASKVSRPINHLVLTVTNIGKRPCNVVNAPFVGFDEAQAPIRIIEDSKPQAVLTLAPGESGYASLILTGEPGPDTHGRTVKKIRVNLTRESGTTVTAPSGTFADNGAAVSYWQQSMDDALQY
ncbi:DUF4232 domain-containing protein [Streptomyces sp. NPDC048604]|uniref:DUF4232 domain-containing protein n=1 Tax=Streptomyces sp. NPDC048604 TaxID=3365578 RepID=UPI003712A225